MPTRYIDIDSTSRNRSNLQIFNDKSTTGPSNFIVSTDTKTSNNTAINRSLDPISNQVEIVKWRRADFMLNTSGASTRGIRLRPFTKLLPDSVQYSVSVPNELILTSVIDTTSSVGIGGLQPSKNYYWGAVLSVDSPAASARIIEYEYLGSNKCLIKTDIPLVLSSTSILQIVDPTTNHEFGSTVTDSAFLFVPGGPPMESLIGATLFAEITSGKVEVLFEITSHDVSRNMITVLLDPASTGVYNSDLIHEISDLSIRLNVPIGDYNQPMDFLNTSDMNGFRIEYDTFPFKADANMSDVTDRNFIEIKSDREYGVAVVSGTTNTQFTIVGASRTESLEDNAYTACTIRLILNDTLDPNLYTTEDRIVSAYVGDTGLVTVSEKFANDISTYDVIKYIIFCETEAVQIKSVLDVPTTVYEPPGNFPTGGNFLNLLDYGGAQPGILSKDRNYDIASSALRLGDFYKGTISKSLIGSYVGFLGNQNFRAYGYIINHVITFFPDNLDIVKFNYIEVNQEFFDQVDTVRNGGTLPTFVKSATMIKPFTRNPIAKFSTNELLERYAILLQTEDNHSFLLNSGGGFTSPNIRNPHEYKISLVNLSLPNKLLKSSKGGYITEYPFVYVRFSNIDTSKAGAFLSNNKKISNKNINFKVLINNTVDDQTTPFVTLAAGDMRQTQTLVLENDIQFSVYLPDGSLFQTVDNDTISPKKPIKDLQISALFSIENICVSNK
jgi:hypothetical protein